MICAQDSQTYRDPGSPGLVGVFFCIIPPSAEVRGGEGGRGREFRRRNNNRIIVSFFRHRPGGRGGGMDSPIATIIPSRAPPVAPRPGPPRGPPSRAPRVAPRPGPPRGPPSRAEPPRGALLKSKMYFALNSTPSPSQKLSPHPFESY